MVAEKNKKAAPQAQSWYKDRYQYVLVQRKLLTLVTMGALGCTLLMLIIIMQLIPLKTVEPFVIQVDQKSGITHAVDPLTVKALTTNEAVNNYFIVQYLRARENYESGMLAHNYNIVRLMSEPSKVYPEFVAAVNPNNPQSNVARLGSTGTRKVKMKSITYLDPQTVQIRLLVEEKEQSTQTSHKILLLKFEYTKMNLTSEERYINPLGFRVMEYRIDDEVVLK